MYIHGRKPSRSRDRLEGKPAMSRSERRSCAGDSEQVAEELGYHGLGRPKTISSSKL